jgi:hypothetical protein
LDPRTKLPDPWRFYLLTPETRKSLWSKVSPHGILFTDFNRGDYIGFGQELANSVVLYHPKGFVRVAAVVPGMKAELHGVSFSGGLSRYRDDFLRLQDWVFGNFPIERLEVFVPTICRSVRRFLKEAGWKEEGILRKRRLFQGSLIDMSMMSILKGEVYGNG